MAWRRRNAGAAAAVPPTNIREHDNDVLVYEGGRLISLRQDQVTPSGYVPPAYVVGQLMILRTHVDRGLFDQLYIVGLEYNAQPPDIQVGITETMSIYNTLQTNMTNHYNSTKHRGKKEELQIINRNPGSNKLVGNLHGIKRWYIKYINDERSYNHNHQLFNYNAFATHLYNTKQTNRLYTAKELKQSTHPNPHKRKGNMMIIGTIGSLGKILRTFNPTVINNTRDDILRPVLIRLSNFLNHLRFWNCHAPHRLPQSEINNVIQQIQPVAPGEGFGEVAQPAPEGTWQRGVVQPAPEGHFGRRVAQPAPGVFGAHRRRNEAQQEGHWGRGHEVPIINGAQPGAAQEDWRTRAARARAEREAQQGHLPNAGGNRLGGGSKIIKKSKSTKPKSTKSKSVKSKSTKSKSVKSKSVKSKSVKSKSVKSKSTKSKSIKK